MTEAPALRCKACGAAVGEQDIQCPYCKSQLATVACPRCFGMVSLNARHCPHCGQGLQIRDGDRSSNLGCPACGAAMVVTDLGDASLHQCHACGGLWLAKETFDRVAATHESRGQVLGVLPGEGAVPGPVSFETIRYRPCPCCRQFMNRVNYARISKVVVDVCKEHGIWFDRDELRRVLEFIDAGGLMRAQERERMQLEEERSNLAMEKAAASMAGMGQAETPGFLGGPWKEGPGTGSLLGRIALGAFETLLDSFRR